MFFLSKRLRAATIFYMILNSAHPETVFLPDLYVMLKILSLEYQLYACGKIFRRP